MNNKYVWTLGIIAVSLILSGVVGVWTILNDDRDPKFHSISVEPTKFRFTGGRAQVLSEVSDDVAVDQVRGVLWLGESQIASVPMNRSDAGEKGPIYSAEFAVPANIRSTGQQVDYSLQILVLDSAGQESKEEVRIEVLAPSVPPPPPQLLSVD